MTFKLFLRAFEFHWNMRGMHAFTSMRAVDSIYSYTLLFKDSFFILRKSFFFHSPKNPEAEIIANNRQRNSKSNG